MAQKNKKRSSEQLHGQIQGLAPGAAIAKACTLLDIPKPPHGYWAKKAAGHSPCAAAWV